VPDVPAPGLVYPFNLRRQFAWNTPVSEITLRLRCSDCKGTDVTIYEAMR
jgi:hypothetical protein